MLRAEFAETHFRRRVFRFTQPESGHRRATLRLGLVALVVACSPPPPPESPASSVSPGRGTLNATTPAGATPHHAARRGSEPAGEPPNSAGTPTPAPTHSDDPTASSLLHSSAPPGLVNPPPPGPLGLAGVNTPVAWIASGNGGHWTALCEAPKDTNGDRKLEVEVGPHGELRGDALVQVLYVGKVRHVIDEFAGADPTGRYVAYVSNAELLLLDIDAGSRIHFQDADTRATRASFQPLRSVAFSDDGKQLAYLRGGATPSLIVHELPSHAERAYALTGGSPYRIRFAPGGRFLRVETPRRDTNKNGRLDWLHAARKDPPRCPSPIATYDVWQFPGDEPESDLLDLQTGKLFTPEGFVVASGSVIVKRTDDRRLTAETPGRPPWSVSSSECNGRVHHVDGRSGIIVFGCASAWGQRRDLFWRAPDTRVPLGFNVAAFELDGVLPWSDAILSFYPGNESWLFNVRTRERWRLPDGTQVHGVHGNAALIEHNLELRLVTLNADATHSSASLGVRREPFSATLRAGGFVAVGQHLFDLQNRRYDGRWRVSGAPLTLSAYGLGLFPTRPASPTQLALGPLEWRAAERSLED